MRELTYKLPFKRLTKLSRSMTRKAFTRMWWARWLLLALYIAVLIGLIRYIDSITDIMASIGVPSGLLRYGFFIALAITLVMFFVGFKLIRRFQSRETQARVDFDKTVHLVQDEHGIRIGTDEIEYYVKWAGISQLLIEPDGVVISHGTLFWLIPDEAFASPAERLSFIRDIYSRLNDRARSISERQIGTVLAGAEGRKAA